MENKSIYEKRINELRKRVEGAKDNVAYIEKALECNQRLLTLMEISDGYEDAFKSADEMKKKEEDEVVHADDYPINLRKTLYFTTKMEEIDEITKADAAETFDAICAFCDNISTDLTEGQTEVLDGIIDVLCKLELEIRDKKRKKMIFELNNMKPKLVDIEIEIGELEDEFKQTTKMIIDVLFCAGLNSLFGED